MNGFHAVHESLHESFSAQFHEPFGEQGDEPVPDVSAEEKASMELVKRVHKLRWIGMDTEARLLQDVLHHLPPVGGAPAYPGEMD